MTSIPNLCTQSAIGDIARQSSPLPLIELSPLEDGAGGAAITNPSAQARGSTRLRVVNPRLRALDVHKDPNVSILDLSGCFVEGTFHLQLDCLPNLTTVILPSSQQGAIIHLFSDTTLEALNIEGPLAEIDACWQGGSTTLRHPEAYWRSLRLLDMKQVAQATCDAKASGNQLSAGTPDDSLTVVMSHNATGVDHFTCNGGGDWLITDASCLTTFSAESVNRVVIQRGRRLQTVTLGCVNEFRADGLHALSRICTTPNVPLAGAVSAHAPNECKLVLSGAMNSLSIEGSYTSITLHCDWLTQLSVEQVTLIKLFNTGRIREFSAPTGVAVECDGALPEPLVGIARFYIDEATLVSIVERLEAVRDEELLDSVLRMLPFTKGHHGTFHNLITLQRLAEKGFDPDKLWQCRRRLFAMHQLSRKSSLTQIDELELQAADKTWNWKFPTDRNDEGYRADLLLWSKCVDHCQQAKNYKFVLKREMQDANALVHLARLVSNPRTDEHLQALFLEAVEAFHNDTACDEGGQESKLRISGLLVPLITASHRLELPDKTVVLLIALVMDWSPWRRLHSRLDSIRRYHNAAVRTLLIQRIATLSASNHWLARKLISIRNDDDLFKARQALMQLVLSPPPQP